MTDPITVVLVDDHHIVREGLQAFLSTQDDIDVVGEAGDGPHAIDLVTRLRPDVALVDLILGETDGVETTREIKKASPATQVVVLTSFDDQHWIVPALRAGALSYVLKDLGAAELSDVIRRAHANESVLHPRVAGHVVGRLHDNAPDTVISGLTDRELEVLRMIGNGKTNAQIAADLVISEKTVKGHVGNILAKLNLNDRTQAAVLAWRSGIIHS